MTSKISKLHQSVMSAIKRLDQVVKMFKPRRNVFFCARAMYLKQGATKCPARETNKSIIILNPITEMKLVPFVCIAIYIYLFSIYYICKYIYIIIYLWINIQQKPLTTIQQWTRLDQSNDRIFCTKSSRTSVKRETTQGKSKGCYCIPSSKLTW